MTQQDDITQRVLTDAEIQALWDEACKDSPQAPGWNRHIRFARALLSRLRAPVADTLPLEAALHVLVDKIVPGLDTGDLVHDAGRASAMLSGIMANAPVAEERAAFESRMMDNGRDISTADGSYLDEAVERDWQALASAPVSEPLTHRCANCSAVFQGAGCPSCRLAAPPASAPVAGEQIIAWDVQDTGLGRRYTTYNPKVAEDLMNLGENVRPLVYASALPPANPAPQASAENVRLRELLVRCQAWMLSSEHDRPNMLIALIQDALQSQPQADKDGCTCPSGDGSLRHPCPMHPGVDKDGGQQRAGDVDALRFIAGTIYLHLNGPQDAAAVMSAARSIKEWFGCQQRAGDGKTREAVDYPRGGALNFDDAALAGAEGIRSPSNACMHRNECRAMLDRQERAGDAIRDLIAKHAELLESSDYVYFELARTRQTGWMAWLCSHPVETNPDRKVLARGQGVTPDEACRAAMADFDARAALSAPQAEQGDAREA